VGFHTAWRGMQRERPYKIQMFVRVWNSKAQHLLTDTRHEVFFEKSRVQVVFLPIYNLFPQVGSLQDFFLTRLLYAFFRTFWIFAATFSYSLLCTAILPVLFSNLWNSLSVRSHVSRPSGRAVKIIP
jgi:hypothetical protein